MKIRIALVAALVLGLAASLAVAAPANGPKAQTATTSTTSTTTSKKACRPHASLILKGNLVAVADDQLSFTMSVRHANRHAKQLKGETVTVLVSTKTKIWRLGEQVALNTLRVGDRLVVQARACRKSVDPTLALRAIRVMAKPAKVTSTVCRPRAALILRGPLAAVAGDQLSFTIDVKWVNRHAKAFKGQTITVQVDARTKVRRLGELVTLASLTIGDRLVVQARTCKASAELTAPLAVRIFAKPAKPAPTTTTTI